jgi:hypothetical protein
MDSYSVAYTYRNPHRQSLMVIEQEIQQRTQQIEFLKARLAELEEARRSVLPLAQAEADEEMTASLPALCLRVMSFTPTLGVSAPAIREGLKRMGVEVKGRNPLGIIYTTMGRLIESGYAIPVETQQGQPAQHFQITPAGQSYLTQVFKSENDQPRLDAGADAD